MLPELLDQIADDQRLGIVTADGAQDTRTSHAAIAARGAAAIIPPRRNGKPWKEPTAGAAVRNEALRSFRRLGRAIWKRWTEHHRQSPAEAKMRCFKLLGERVMSRAFDHQVAELPIRAPILNHFTALGTPITRRAG
jgi:NADPH-dependent 2,4-dienoyl-CoA reductase/sulfur reductase-like enzyme